MRQYITYLQISRRPTIQLREKYKTAYDSIRIKVLYNILTKLSMPMKLVRLINLSIPCCLDLDYMFWDVVLHN
jgi:hypothetical protein